MNHLRHYLSAAACGILCAGLLIGCGSNSADDTPGSVESTSESAEVTLLAAAGKAEYPEEPAELDDDATEEERDAYWDAMNEYWEQQEAEWPDSSYLDSLQSFSARTIQQVLTSGDPEKPNENMVYSPASLYMALTMLTETADGNTRQQLLDLLGTDDVEEMRTQTQLIWKALCAENEYGKTTLANSLWLNSSISSFHQDTLELLSNQYFASTYSAPMGSEKTDGAIAEWIDENTGDLLTEQSGSIKTQESALAYLYSTLYFYQQWQDRFEEEQTTEAVFTCADDTEQTVDFMHTTEIGSFVRGDGYTMAWRGFKDNASMLFVLPDEGTDISELLNNMELQQVLLDTETRENAATEGDVVWSVPKFDVSSGLKLKDSLEALGVTDVFTEQADLSNLSDEMTWVDEVTQAARVRVDETGCEAAAYTEVVYFLGGMIQDPETCEMNLNRPFLFVITGEDNLPLFVGVVNQAEE